MISLCTSTCSSSTVRAPSQSTHLDLDILWARCVTRTDGSALSTNPPDLGSTSDGSNLQARKSVQYLSVTETQGSMHTPAVVKDHAHSVVHLRSMEGIGHAACLHPKPQQPISPATVQQRPPSACTTCLPNGLCAWRALCHILALRIPADRVLHLSQDHALADQPLEGLGRADSSDVVQNLRSSQPAICLSGTDC